MKINVYIIRNPDIGYLASAVNYEYWGTGTTIERAIAALKENCDRYPRHMCNRHQHLPINAIFTTIDI